MVLFGNGSVAQVLLTQGQQSAPGQDGFGNYQSINWGWGLGVMLGIYIGGEYVPTTLSYQHTFRTCKLIHPSPQFRRLPQPCRNLR